MNRWMTIPTFKMKMIIKNKAEYQLYFFAKMSQKAQVNC